MRFNTGDSIMKLTQEELKEILTYNAITGNFRWKESRSNIKAGDIAGCKRPDGYVSIRIDKKLYLAHRLAWLYTEGYFPENFIDHIDRNTSNNIRKNLREATNQCNIRNSKRRNDNASGITGIYWYKSKSQWRAQIMVNQKSIHLGYFENKIDAVKARWDAEVEHNFPNCNTTSSAYNYLNEKRI